VSAPRALKRPLRILIVHQYFLLPGMAGGSRFNELARMWTERGHEVTVIAGNLDYTTGEVPERYRHRWTSHETEDGIDVWRCHVPASYNRSYWGRAWAFAGFTLSAATAALRTRAPDVVIGTSPPLVSIIPASIAARLRGRGAPWVFEVRDLWPESAVTTGVLSPSSPITKLLYGLERWGYAAADKINVLTPAFRDDIVKRGLAPSTKIAMIPNGADVRLFQPGPRDNEARKAFGWGDKFVVMYAGAHGRANAIGQLVDAAERLRDRPDILLACVGDGPERARWQKEAIQRGLANIVFHGAQSKERMPEIVRACDVGAAVLQHNPTFRTVYPNKVFDYMACSRPVLLAIDGVARELVCEQARAGVFAEPENAGALADAIVSMEGDPRGRAEMGERGRNWVLENVTREALSERYLGLIEELAG
jgi:glycosyltransferase involved in cell wall biosynthesis